MKLKQREANQKAIACAAGIIESEDFTSLFGEDYGFSEKEAEQAHNDAVMRKAQQMVVRRISAMLKDQP